MSSDSVTLSSGHKMPLVGFGLWKVPNETCADTVYNAIKTGYRLFDGAADYGNEKEAGQGVARAIKDGLVKREDLFITSKLWNSFHEKDKVVPIAKQQLEDWGIDYFDLYLIHFPIALEYVARETKYPSGFRNLQNQVVPINVPLHETWAAMEDVATQGLAKSIGVSNYQGSLMLDLFRYARIQPAVLQIEHHPYLAQPGLVQLCRDHHVAVTAYSSFGPQSFLELKFKRAEDTPLLLENEAVVGIGKAHGKTPAQVLLRWATQRGIAVIPKSNNQGRLQQNLDVTQWNLSEAELQQISGLDRNLRFNNPVDYGVPIPIFV